MSKPSRFWSVLYNTEASWGDSATNTYGTRLQVLAPPELSLERAGIPVPIAQQYHETGIADVSGPFSGSFTIRLGLAGHGGVTTGALTATDLHTLLRNFFGNGNSSMVGDTIASATSASQFADAGAFVGTSAELCRVGVQGDARGNGQFVALNDAGTITLLSALDGTPNAADQIYAALSIFPDEQPAGTAITSTRWQIQSANNQWRLYGCFPMSCEFSGMNHGEVPQVALTYGVSYYASTSQTFPDATAVSAQTLAPVTMGSVFIQDVGTVTRAKYSARSWGLAIDNQVTPLMGPGAANDGQIIVGAVRTKCAAKINMQFDAEAAGTTTWADLWDARTLQQVLVTLGTGAAADDGKMLGWYFRNCRMSGSRPVQSDGDGVNRVDVTFEAMTGDTTGATAPASWRLAMG